MYASAIVSPSFDREPIAGYAVYCGPTVGVRASLSSMPLAEAMPSAVPAARDDWPVHRHADGSIDLDAYREAARRERAKTYDEFLWKPLRRLIALGRQRSSTPTLRQARR